MNEPLIGFVWALFSRQWAVLGARASRAVEN